MDLSQGALQTNGRLFPNFEFDFEYWPRNKSKKFQTDCKGIAGLRFRPIIHQWIHLNKLYELMESFFQISNSISNFGPKTDFFFFKRIARQYLVLNIWCYTSMDLSQWALQIGGKHFPNFNFVLEFLAENAKFFKRIGRREYWSKYNELYINGFVMTSSTNY